MAKELTQTEIKKFIASNGLALDALDERDDALEAWQQECNVLIRGFVNYVQDRFASIEHRLDRLEDRHRHQTD